MKSITMSVLTFGLIGSGLLIADTKVKMEDLPPAVQSAIKEQTKGAVVSGVSKEVDKGKTSYEVETKVNGKSRDLEFDANGKLLSVEEEVDLSTLPAPAKEAIEKKAAGGKIKKVEKLIEGTAVSYEAAIQKGGKTSEVGVNPDGSEHK